jgi:DNA-binding PadR family transcriptional regulator
MLSAADLQLILLALLEERPRHGYDFIKAIEELTGGAYTPSPGMIYPALSYLDEIGQVTAQPDGAKKQYRLTEAGLRPCWRISSGSANGSGKRVRSTTRQCECGQSLRHRCRRSWSQCAAI